MPDTLPMRFATLVLALALFCHIAQAHTDMGPCSTAYSQSNDGIALLQRTAQTLTEGGGVKATFTLTTPDDGSIGGSIDLQGECFRLQMGGLITWFDGTTQWTYSANTEEVNVSLPTTEELQAINPYAWLTLYKQGYAVSVERSSSSGGQTKQVVTMTKPANSRGPAMVKLTMLSSTCQLTRVEIVMSIGEQPTTIDITSYQAMQNFPSSHFCFPADQYPSAEIIDLR